MDLRPVTRLADAFRGLSPRRRALLYAALLVAGVLLVTVAVPPIAGLFRGERPAPPQDRPGAVLLVPGYGGDTESLTRLGGRIQATGRTVVVVRLPGDGTGDLTAQAAALARDVDDALAAGSPSVDVIGYSAGGVVARLWAQERDHAHQARRIITLGSPHHGTAVAASVAATAPAACPVACRELVPGSPLLEGLVRPVPTPPEWLALWTAQDETVTPPDSARLEGAINVELQSVCPTARISHSELPTSSVVTSIVMKAISKSPLTAPAIGC
jgi:triacylglycerol lipase